MAKKIRVGKAQFYMSRCQGLKVTVPDKICDRDKIEERALLEGSIRASA